MSTAAEKLPKDKAKLAKAERERRELKKEQVWAAILHKLLNEPGAYPLTLSTKVFPQVDIERRYTDYVVDLKISDRSAYNRVEEKVMLRYRVEEGFTMEYGAFFLGISKTWFHKRNSDVAIDRQGVYAPSKPQSGRMPILADSIIKKVKEEVYNKTLEGNAFPMSGSFKRFLIPHIRESMKLFGVVNYETAQLPADQSIYNLYLDFCDLRGGWMNVFVRPM